MDREFLLRMSYMEIYNEEINDLLAPEHRKLQIHESVEVIIYYCFIYLNNAVTENHIYSLCDNPFWENEARNLCCWFTRRNCCIS